MKRLTRDFTMPEFDKSLSPVIEIEPGEKFVVETNLGAKPATGPASIIGAEPGDTLVVTIHEIKVLEAHWWWRWPTTNETSYGEPTFSQGQPFRQGVYKELGKYLDGYPRREHPRLGPGVDATIPVEDNLLVFSEQLRVPLRPVIGCIGVAPAGEPRATNLSGHYGGNFDCREIEPGARVYFPVSAPGGLMGLCDVHGAQSDGELFPTVEVVADVTLSAEVSRGLSLPMIFVETEETIHSIGCGQDLAEATNDAIRGMIQVLEERLGFSFVEAAQLIGTCADIRICQLVDPVINMRVSMPKVAVPELKL